MCNHAVQAANERQLQHFQQQSQADLARLEATWTSQMGAKDQEFREAMAARDRDSAKALNDMQNQWRRELDDAHTRFAQERASLTAEYRHKGEEADKAAQRQLLVRR